MPGSQPNQEGLPSDVSPRERRAWIVEFVTKRGRASADELSAHTGVSLMTAYRDIAALEEIGILQRHRGYVVAVASGLQEASVEFRMEQNLEEKRAIAAAAAKLILDGSSLLLDDSTTSVYTLRAARTLPSSTVITNSLLVAREAEQMEVGNLFVLGGRYEAWSQSTVGTTVIKTLTDMHADLALISTSGLVGTDLCHPYQPVATVKTAMLRAAQTRVLLMDHTKFSRSSLFKFASVADIDVVVVDRSTAKQHVQWLKEQVETVIIAE